jgi:2-succinyl-6-hydroxy-2,4-cyclohexadiene-1-carboxylate synthase
MGNCYDFLAVINYLSEFCCLAVDLPGHGKTEVQQDCNYSMVNTARALIKLLQKLDINKCFLVGYSMGGRLALYLTVYFPQYFPRVILESASPGLKTRSGRDRRIGRDLKLAKQLESQDFSLFLQQWYGNPLFASFVCHPNYERAIASRLNNNPFNLAKSLLFMGLGIQPSLWDCLVSIKIPVLLVVGELDTKFVAINREIAILSSQTSLHIVKNAGHNIHFERPPEFGQLIRYFCLL